MITNIKTITFEGPRIDDLFFRIEKTEYSYENPKEDVNVYTLVISPNCKGGHAEVRSSGCAIGTDEQAKEFLKRLTEIQELMKLPKF